ncbi:hypothetical protein [Candidatus Electronema sp. PJ]|uniref:hypothetical protein n=1 Tax=Candidatus Electronema sp. PJ TaxID=3401572 RepID=UPI003AA9AE93
MLAVLLIVIAGVTVLIMLEMNSKVHEEQEKTGWIDTHRFLGYLFLVLFAFMLAFMVFKVGSFREDMPIPVTILALLLIPLIMIKVVIARQKTQISTKLILLGTAIFGLSFGLTGITAKYHASHGWDFPSLFLTNVGSKDMESVEPGQIIMSRKCNKCHSLERVYTTAVADWSPTVNKMAALDYPNITSSEVKEIVDYLNQQQARRKQQKLQSDTERGRKLVSSKCTHCHTLDRVFRADMNEQRWNETIDDMVKIMGIPDYLSAQDKRDIVSFLSHRREERRELWAGTENEQPIKATDGVRGLISQKCSAGCHALDRVLRTKKTREEWAETISSMIEITGDTEYLSAKEKEQIINFLSLPPEQRGKKQEDADAQPKSSRLDHPLVNSKCGGCHTLERVHQAEKSKEEWEKTVNSMAQGTGDPNYLSEQEKKDIVTIISSWEVVK